MANQGKIQWWEAGVWLDTPLSSIAKDTEVSIRCVSDDASPQILLQSPVGSAAMLEEVSPGIRKFTADVYGNYAVRMIENGTRHTESTSTCPPVVVVESEWAAEGDIDLADWTISQTTETAVLSVLDGVLTVSSEGSDEVTMVHKTSIKASRIELMNYVKLLARNPNSGYSNRVRAMLYARSKTHPTRFILRCGAHQADGYGQIVWEGTRPANNYGANIASPTEEGEGGYIDYDHVEVNDASLGENSISAAGGSGVPVNGDLITGDTSGATGIFRNESGGKLYMDGVSGVFVDGETVSFPAGTRVAGTPTNQETGWRPTAGTHRYGLWQRLHLSSEHSTNDDDCDINFFSDAPSNVDANGRLARHNNAATVPGPGDWFKLKGWWGGEHVRQWIENRGNTESAMHGMIDEWEVGMYFRMVGAVANPTIWEVRKFQARART